ncbi:MAG: hypothetical protein M1820_005320 [Bogoriella megaspora]|nr:MAG: hypothetical protein M1820_005320 [Bogoriella megaspora]
MDPPPFAFPPSPGTPLFPLSPERVNGTRTPYGYDSKTNPLYDPRAPQSPSLPSLPSFSPSKPSHGRTSSEVQGMVARFNSLEINDHAEMRRRDELALRKAEMGREQAELRLEKVREELRKMQKDGAESRDRERRMAKRIESLTEEKIRREETHAHAQTIYEKEIRKARKDQYKSESLLVKTQEELKACRKQLNAAHVNIDIEKAKATQREQESFQSEYKLVGIHEELAKSQERVKFVEEERDALKTSLKEEELARVAAEGRIALPTSKDADDDEFASPKKSPAKRRVMDLSEDKENLSPQRTLDIKAAKAELAVEKNRRVRAEQAIDFMKMECQFKRCSCRVAERKGSKYVHDLGFVAQTEKVQPISESPKHATIAIEEDVKMLDPADEQVEARLIAQSRDDEMEVEPQPQIIEEKLCYSPDSGTFHKGEAPNSMDQQASDSPSTERKQAAEADQDENSTENAQFARSTTPAYPPPAQYEAPVSAQPAEPATEEDLQLYEEPMSPTHLPSDSSTSAMPIETPLTPHVHEIHTTTTIPVHFTPQHPTHIIHPLENDFATPSPSTAAFPAIPPPPMTPASQDTNPNTLDENGNPIAPATIDREAALEAIRQRRGRARSFAEGKLTPRKQMLEGVKERRDISAPVLGTASASKVNLQRLTRSASKTKRVH